ncbi:CNP1-like family protein [Hydrogenophaga aquatica]
MSAPFHSAPSLAAALLSCACAGAFAQRAADDVDWRESEVPAPPALRTEGLLKFDVSVNSELSYGVDPASIGIGEDGVVRYVMVAASRSGALNALYEGVRCATGEVKTYARWNPAPPGSWTLAQQPQWRPMLAGNAASRPALALARAGLCQGAAPNGPVPKMLRELRYGRPTQP